MGLASMIGGSSSSGGGSNFEFRMITLALVMLFLMPTLFILIAPAHVQEDTEWADEIGNLQEQYYAQSGQHSTPEQNIWTLTGIYTPYEGNTFGYTDDGWVYGSKVYTDAPTQYANNILFKGNLVVAQAPNGLFYYISVPQSMTGITPLKPSQYTQEGGRYVITDTEGATVYSSVYFNSDKQSNIFFTTASKQEQGGHYYYAFTGQRYVFQPLKDYATNIDGETTKVTANSTSLSLIWYRYTEMTSGIAGQLAISGTDKGVSYLSADDIVRAFNSTNYSSKFDMTFNGGVQMHLVIRLDPSRLSASTSENNIRDCYNNGYWSVLVYSDSIVDSFSSATYEFSAENILGTLVSLFTFNIAEDYNVDGWVGIFAGLMITLPFYAALMAVIVNHPLMAILIPIIAALQAIAKFTSFSLLG